MTILQSLLPLHCGKFWRFSKTCHFSNIRCFLRPFFAQNNSNVSLEALLACFWQFKFLSKNDDFAKPIAFAL